MRRFLFVLTLVLFGASVAHAQEVNPLRYPENTITVTGSGTAYGEPNVAYLELGVELVDPDLTVAFPQAVESMNSVMQALSELGIAEEDIQTTGVTVFPEERFNPQDSRGQGERVYRVRNTVRVTVRDVAQIEPVISAAVSAGANTIYNLNFGIDDTQALEQDARTQAVENAHTRAQQLSDALGLTLGQPIIVSETFGNAVFPQDRVGLGGASFAMPVSPGQLSVDVQVQITFSVQGS